MTARSRLLTWVCLDRVGVDLTVPRGVLTPGPALRLLDGGQAPPASPRIGPEARPRPILRPGLLLLGLGALAPSGGCGQGANVDPDWSITHSPAPARAPEPAQAEPAPAGTHGDRARRFYADEPLPEMRLLAVTPPVRPEGDWQESWRPWLSGGPAALDGEEEHVLVADELYGGLNVYRQGGLVRRYPCPPGARQVVVGPDDRAWLAVRSGRHVYMVDLAEHSVQALPVEACVEPTAVALSPLADVLYVACGADGLLAAMDTGTLEVLWRYRVAPDPRGIAVAPDGRSVVVTHLTGDQVTRLWWDDRDRLHGYPQALAAYGEHPLAERAQGLVATAAGGGVFSPLRQRLFAPNLVRDLSVPAQPRNSGGYYEPPSRDLYRAAARPVVSVFRATGGAADRTDMDRHLLGDSGDDGRNVLQQVNLPGAPAHAATRPLLIVPMTATDRVVVYDSRTDRASFRPVAIFGSGQGPTGVVIRKDGRQAFVWNEFSREVHTIHLGAVDPDGADADGSVPRGRSQLWSADPTGPRAGVDLGRRLFHLAGAGLSGDPSVACAVCHPEGRTDRSIWEVPGGVRNPPSLAGRLVGTEPYNWFADEQTLQHKIGQAVWRMGGDDGQSGRLGQVAAWLTSLPPPPAPSVDPDLARLGEELYHSPRLYCDACHDGPMLTNQQRRKVFHEGREVDVPILIGVGSSPPYFHDGRYPTLEAIFEDPQLVMGGAYKLSGHERRALVAYLKTL